MRYLLILIILFITHNLNAQIDLCPKMNNPIRGVQYVSDYCKKDMITHQVYYIIYKDSLGNYGRKKFHLTKNPQMPGPGWYAATGYDMGHMQSSASSKSDLAAWESFDMVNIVPQVKAFNRGIWKRTEIFERKNCDKYAYVICGNVTKDSVWTRDKILVPDIFYKVIYNPFINEMIGFIIHKDQGYDSIWNHVVTVHEVEKLIHKELFTQLDKSKKKLKYKIDISKWNH